MNVGNSKFICGLLLLTLGYTSSSDSGENKTECDPELQFPCADGSGCTYLDYRCDGDNDCADKSDESEEICKDNCGGMENRFRCADGKCLRGEYAACSGVAECADGSDEDEKLCSDCNGDGDRWKCRGSTKCIRKYYKCDSDLDCGADDPSDEDPSICGEDCGGFEGRLQCANKNCLYETKVCNGFDDCGDNTDESDETCANCNGKAGRTKCAVTSKCFTENDKCDGFKDCAIRNEEFEIVTDDNSDEENCPNKNESSESIVPPISYEPLIDVAPTPEE